METIKEILSIFVCIFIIAFFSSLLMAMLIMLIKLIPTKWIENLVNNMFKTKKDL